MDNEKRIEIAQKIAAGNGAFRAWNSPDKKTVRVYDDRKGFAVVDENGDLNIDRVAGNRFSDIKTAAEAAGIKTYRR